MTDLSSRTAVVTGGASGIGAALVAALTEEGASVLAVDLDEAGLAAVAAATGCATMAADVSTRETNVAIAARATDLFGEVHFGFLNAGILDRQIHEMGQQFGVNDLDWDRYELVRGVLLDGVIHGTAALADVMNSGGSIVATASAAGLGPWAPTPLYSSMKHAVVGWTRSICTALGSEGIRINAICPGGIATPLLGMAAEAAAQVVSLLAPRTVADAMIEIACGEATGEAWSIVGGRLPELERHEFATIPDFPSRTDF